MNGTLHTENGRYVLRFERRLPHPPEKVWRAITDPGHLSSWFPADMAMELRSGAPIRFHFRENEGPDGDGVILDLDPPRAFAFTWGDELLRFELRSDGDGCVLVFTDTFDDPAKAARDAAGWDLCLERLHALLDGTSADLPPQRWHERFAAYRKEFGPEFSAKGAPADHPVNRDVR
jgi:uncharacterized protein YndB with AHSA1/START domain